MAEIDGFVNVRDPGFGAKGDGIANDRDAIVAALEVAGDESCPRPLYFPPGVYRIELSSKDAGGADGSWALHLKRDVAIVGAGAEFSVIEFETAEAEKRFLGFRIHANTAARFSRLKIRSAAPRCRVRVVRDPENAKRLLASGHQFETGTRVVFVGPPGSIPGGIERNSVEYHVVAPDPAGFSIVSTPGGDALELCPAGDTEPPAFVFDQTDADSAIRHDGGSGDLTLERVTIEGGWREAINDEEGNHATTLVESDLHGLITTCFIWGASYTETFEKELRATRCVFRPCGSHHLYIHPVVAFELIDCRHYGAGWYSVHNYGEGDFTRAIPPAFARIHGSDFDSECGTAIRTGGAAQDGRGTTYSIRDCHFHNHGTAIRLRDSAEIVSCVFESQGGIQSDPSESDRRVLVRDCVVSVGANRSAAIITADSGPLSAWSVVDCRFRQAGDGDAISHTRLANEEADWPVEFLGCTFLCETGQASIGVISKATVFRDCAFVGKWFGGLQVANFATSTRIELWHCRSSLGETLPLVSTNGAELLEALDLRGGDNEFSGRMAVVHDVHAGKIRLGHGFGPRLASALSLAIPSWAFDRYVVEGDEAIQFLQLMDHDSTTRAISGSLHLIAAGPWSLGAGGNVVAKHGDPRAVGEVIHLEREPTSYTWKEI